MALSNIGDRLIRSKEWLLEAVSRRVTVSFQWWFNESDDIDCRARFIANYAVLEFGLDGMDDGQERLFIGALVELFKICIRAGAAVGLVIDRTGATVNYSWDAFFLNGATLDQDLPDVLGLRSNALSRVGILAPDTSKSEIDGFLLLRNTT